jgi:WD40 repeat protein
MSTSPTKTSKKGPGDLDHTVNEHQNVTSTSTSPSRTEGEDQKFRGNAGDLIVNGEDLTFAKCKICQKLLHNNRECQNCHGLFCFDHLKQHLKNAPECPNCHKTPVTLEEDFVHNFIVQRLVNETVINCPMGCGTQFQYSDMQNHSNTCTKSIVQCPMVKYGCDWTGERGNLRNHGQNSCPFHRMKNVLDAYEEKINQRDLIIQQQKKYVEEIVLKKDMHILHLTRELQHAQSLLQRYGINVSSHDSLAELSRPQMFTDLLSDRRDQFMQPTPLHHHSLFGDSMGHQSMNQPLNDLIISPSNKASMNKQQQQQQHHHHQHHPSPIGKRSTNSYASVVEGNGITFTRREQHKLFDEHISMSPINGFSIGGDVEDSPDDDLLNDQIVNQVIHDMDEEHKAGSNENGDEYDSMLANAQHHQQDEEEDSDDGEPKFLGNRHVTEKLPTPVTSGPDSSATRYLLAGGGVGSIKVWDINDAEECIMSLKGHTRFVSALHTHQGRVCSGSGDTSIRIWDFGSGECEKTLSGCDGKVGALCSYGNVLVSGSKDGATNHKIRLWNTDKGQCVRTLQGHSDWINVLCAHDKMLFSGSGDRTVRIWDLERGKCLLKYENPSFVLSLYHHAGHNLLYCGTYDGMIRTWDLRVSQGKVIRTVKAHGSGVLSLAHHDGLLCSGSKDETIRVWDYRTLGMTASTGNSTNNKWGATSNNNSVRTFVGHNNAVKCLISYNNKYLASGSYDRTVKLWDVTSASVSNDFSSGDEGMSGEDVSVMTIETGFKVYSLCTFDDMQQ